ncbi:MAG TPA: amidohydrolase [Spirochaetia bacterium]|nr:amidohydrolase [Spirochaetia bacterium]
MGTVLINNVFLLPMDGRGVVEDAQVLVSGSSIVYAGSAGPLPEGFVPERTIDGQGGVVMPGLVNCHTHAAMTLLRSYADDLPLMRWLNEAVWPLEDRMEGEDIYWGTLLCCLEMIRGGVTTFADMYFFMDEAARAVERSGLRASLSRGLIGNGPTAEKGLVESRELVQRWHGAADGRITVMLGPHAPYTCPPSYLARVIELSGELGVGIHIHLAETLAEVTEIKEKYGTTPVDLMLKTGLFERPVLAAHCVHLTPDDIAVLAAHKVGVAHNPESNMKLGSGIAPVNALLQAGVRVGIGTDGAASNNDQDIFGEMRSAALLAKVAALDPTVLPAPQVLHMATAGGAAALGLAGTGVLAPGYRADLILVNIHQPHLTPRHDLAAHLVYAARAADVILTMVDGSILWADGRFTTLDPEEVMAQANKRAGRLVGPR